jgi:IS30 family transposase
MVGLHRAVEQREHQRPAAPILPKNSDLSQCTQRELDAIARSLNTRPRQTLGWMTPSHAFAEAVALTA